MEEMKVLFLSLKTAIDSTPCIFAEAPIVIKYVQFQGYFQKCKSKTLNENI